MAENGGGAVEAGYGALTLGSVAFFSHLIPGTQRGYAVVIDQDTNLATVSNCGSAGMRTSAKCSARFITDMWSSRAKRRRKIAMWRRIAWKARAFIGSRTTARRRWNFFPSAAYSNFVELSRLGGELGFCAPSDYIKINEDLFIYTRTECEFSGTFTAYVMDLNRIEQVGVRLGFDANDALEYYVFRGKGEWLGQLAQFEKFGDESGYPVPAAAPGTDSGERCAARVSAAQNDGENDDGGSRCRLRETHERLRTARHCARRQRRPPHRWPAISDRTPTG